MHTSAARVLAMAPLMFMVVAAGGYFAFRIVSQNQSINTAAYLESAPAVSSLPLPAEITNGDLTLYELEPEFREAQVYDILADGGRVWLGTGKGLLAWEPGVRLTRYQRFSDAPFEWVQDLALDNGRLAVNLLVADATTGGDYAGTHLFDTSNDRWVPLGVNVLDQVWLDGVLWQRPVGERTLLRTTQQGGHWRSEPVAIRTRLCGEAAMAAVGDELWIAQQGSKRSGSGRGTGNVQAIPCGVIRYEPTSSTETYLDEPDGLNSGFGRDIAGDDHQVWVSHSIKHDRLSFWDGHTGTWQSARPYGTGNSIALGHRAVWLATPSSTDPFIRIDRRTQDRTNIAGVPEEFYVSAIGVDGDTIWLGLYKQNWEGSSYTIESYVAKYVDRSQSAGGSGPVGSMR